MLSQWCNTALLLVLTSAGADLQAAVQSAGTSEAAAVSMLVETVSAEVDRVRVHIRAMQQRRLQVSTATACIECRGSASVAHNTMHQQLARFWLSDVSTSKLFSSITSVIAASPSDTSTMWLLACCR
jgi:hypothetical protein